MGRSDLKFFFVIGLVATGAYWFLMGEFKGKTWNLHTRQEPTIQFVPEGTPGAITMEEYTKRKFDR